MVNKTNNLWSTNDVANYYGVTKQAVMLWINERNLPVYKIGPKTFKYDPILVHEWVQEQSRKNGGK